MEKTVSPHYLIIRSVEIVLALLGVIMPVSAQVRTESEKRFRTDSIYELQEVTVQGRQLNALSPGQVIGRKALEAMPSANVADALKYMSGVQIKDYGGLGGQKTINVRSLGSQHVGVYIDGVRITNAQNGTVDLGKYSLSTLESVSLFNANKAEALMTASEYASASTVYLQTRRPEKTELTASASVGSFGTYKGAATWCFSPRQNRGAQNKGVAGFIDAAYTYSKGDYPFEYHTEYEDTTGTRRNSDIQMFRIESCLFHKGWQWHTYYFDSERGLPGGIVRRLSDTYTDVGREWDRNFFSQLSFKQAYPLSKTADKGSIGVRGIVKYTNDWLHYRSDYPENIAAHANNQYHQQDVYGAAAVSWNPRQRRGERDADWKLSLSSDLRWSDLTCDVKNFSYVYRLDSKTSLSVFYNWRGLNLSASGLYTHITDHTRGEAKPLKRVTWNAIASYSFDKSESLRGLSFRTFYKTVFRAPTLNDLYYTLVGNRNLKPEYTKQFDVGLSYSLPPLGGVLSLGKRGSRRESWRGALGLDLSLDFYYNHVEDRIVCLPLKGSYQWTMLNYGYTRCMGMNFSANVNYKCNNLLLSGTFQDDRDRTSPGEDSYNDFIAYSPQWSATAIYTFNYKGWTASLSHMFVDKRYWTAENAIEEPLRAYNCTDVKVGCNLGELGVLRDLRALRGMTLEFECQDLFDARYEIIQRWPMPGRRYAMTMKINI